MSNRSALAERMAYFINELGLNNPFGGEITRGSGRGKPYLISFSKPRYVDGTIYIYGEKFIQVKYQTAFRDLPERDSRVFTNEQDASMFIKKAFIDLDFVNALAITVK